MHVHEVLCASAHINVSFGNVYLQVTPPKSGTGLNPNANVFQSKGATTPPDVATSLSDWPQDSNVEQVNSAPPQEGVCTNPGRIIKIVFRNRLDVGSQVICPNVVKNIFM